MPAVSELLRSRSKAVHDARELLNRSDFGAYEQRKADELLNAADRLDAEAKGISQGRRQAFRMLSSTPASELTYRGWRLRFPDGSREAKLASASYVEAFTQYTRRGESLGLQVTDNSKGGYAAPIQTALIVLQTLDETSVMRQISRVLPPLVYGAGINVPELRTKPADATWRTEVVASDLADDDTATFGDRLLRPQLLMSFVKASRIFVKTAVIDIDAWMSERLGYALSRPAEGAYVAGDGIQKPLGVFTTSPDGLDTDRDFTCSATTAFSGDDCWKALYALAEPYQAGAIWLAHREFFKRAAILKDGNGAYVFRPSDDLDEPDLLCHRPVRYSEQAPSTFTTGCPVAVVGDFPNGYTIVDSIELEVQRLDELLVLKGQLGYLGWMMTDGAVTDSQAFQRMKLA